MPCRSAKLCNNHALAISGHSHGTFSPAPASQGSSVVGTDESDWIDETLAGQASAFGHLVVRYQDRLFNAVFHTLGSRQDAEDVVQEAFVQAYVKLATFQRQSGFYTWIYRIAFNLAVSRRRRQKPVQSIDQVREHTGIEPLSDGEPVDRNLEREEGAQALKQALQKLNEEHRSILVLRELEGLSYEAISEILDLPVGTVRSRLHRARIQLRDHLKPGNN
ncbi:MAG: sigma-70 family RNA polymerase sigma factor [Pirellulaceae bacterium]|nr:sigma-70 family RNA polymerase sigma factor [Pirellulaceae bacterium]